MRLKRLELQGFKSFLDRTIISFDNDITGVVGPNGCGKSNIVDAIQWVMGEQSAKHLRGKDMSDVIFAGSSTQAPTSMAEVTLVMDKQGMSLPAVLATYDRGDEVAVTRRLYRDGTSEYLVNKHACRLKDVHELFMDTGVGRRAYSIIEQGQIDRMVNVKPEDRRHIFEEVAGITKYRSKRKEAERKINQTQQNLDRLQDIINELEKRMRSLKVQASKARKYKEIKVELEHIDLFLLGRKLFDLKKSLVELEEKKLEIETQRSEIDAKFATIDADLTKLDVERIDFEREVEAFDQQERDATAEVQKLENQIAIFEEQQKHLADSQSAAVKEFEELINELQTINTEKTDRIREKEELDASLEGMRTQITEGEGQLTDLETRQSDLESRRDELQEKTSELAQKRVYLTNQQEHATSKQDEENTLREEINQKLTDVVVVLEEKKSKFEELDLSIEAQAKKSEQAEQEVSSLANDCEQISKQLTQDENKLFETREQYHAANSRLESLKELQENLEGYSPTAREILTKLDDKIQAMPLGEALVPREEAEGLVEFLLGDTVNTLLVDSTAQARALADLIHFQELEKVGILATDEIVDEGLAPEAPVGTTPLLSLVGAKMGYDRVVRRWFGKVFLCDNNDELFALRESHPQYTFMSRESQAIARNDRMLNCGKQTAKTGIFERRREIEELTEKSAELMRSVDEITRQRAEALASLEQQEKLQDECKAKLSAIHIEAVEFRKEREQIQAEIHRIDADYTELNVQSERNHKELDEVRAQLETLSQDLEQVQRDATDVEAEITGSADEAQRVEQEVTDLAEIISQNKIELSTKQERLQGMADRIELLIQESSQKEERKQGISNRQEESEKRLAELKELQVQATADQEAATQRRGEFAVKLADAKENHKVAAEKLNEFRAEKDAMQTQKDAIGAEVQEIEIGLAQERANYEHQQSLCVERYQQEPTLLDERAKIELDKLPMFRSAVRVDWATLPGVEKESLLDEHSENLRKKAEKYGEVNLTAINEYDEVEQRHGFLDTQKTDLEASIKILEEAILKIDETTVTRFNETVDGVNEKFQEVFPILFNGGKARLALTNPDDMLESGVDIMVQPPGKTLKSISLLSGGEKALTAVSLILAIFARKPSPFCLLDEVDAPLDDANVSRFNTVIKHMAKKSQFILVTHNRRTMEVADSLYGVTMERAGISKMTSVQLN